MVEIIALRVTGGRSVMMENQSDQFGRQIADLGHALLDEVGGSWRKRSILGWKRCQWGLESLGVGRRRRM